MPGSWEYATTESGVWSHQGGQALTATIILWWEEQWTRGGEDGSGQQAGLGLRTGRGGETRRGPESWRAERHPCPA